MANTFTDKLRGGGNKPVDFAELAANCFSGAQQGLSGSQVAARNDQIAGIPAGRGI